MEKIQKECEGETFMTVKTKLFWILILPYTLLLGLVEKLETKEMRRCGYSEEEIKRYLEEGCGDLADCEEV